MEQLLESQHELHGRIARTWENIKKLGAAKVTVDVIRTSLPLLDQKWKKFETQHYELMRQYRTELEKHEYVSTDCFGTVEMVYAQQRAHLLQVERQFGSSEVEQRAKPEASSHRPAFPRIEIPKFSGKFDDWPAFRDLFVSIVGQESSLTNVEKLHFLKTSVRGDAESPLRNLPAIGDNFDRAWSTLEEHFENKRLHVRSYLSAFTTLPKMREASVGDLRRIFHAMLTTVGALEGLERPIGSSEDVFVHLVVNLFDGATRREWETSLKKTTEPPAYETLREFLQEQLRTEEALQGGPEKVASKPAARTVRIARAAVVRPSGATARGSCVLCNGAHYLAACDKYVRKTPQERMDFILAQGRCPNCLGTHRVSNCNSEKNCFKCSGRHHTSVHDASATGLRPDAASFPAPSVHVAKPRTTDGSPVLLATARVFVTDSTGVTHPARALIDSGSETSLVAESLAQRLRLPRTPTSVAIYGVGGEQSGVARGRVSVTFTGHNRRYSSTVSSLVLPRLSAYNGAVTRDRNSWPHLRGLDLADPEFLAKDPVELLLGADVYANIVLGGLRRGGPQDPVAQHTQIGWILLGAVGRGAHPPGITYLQCSCDEELSSTLRKFWEWEEPPHHPAPLSPEEEEYEQHFTRTHTRLPDGRFQVRLPLRPALPDLAFTRRAASRMLEAMERRFARDSNFRELYCDFMAEYATLRHMSLAPALPALSHPRECFLPHHAVLKQSGTETKMRVVFNGSSCTPAGPSLNSALLTGRNLLPPLSDIVIRWRCHQYAFVTDIQKMYRQIQAHPDDRDLQKILWRHDGEVIECHLNTVTYGLACAPFLAIRVLHQLADEEEASLPMGAQALRQDAYVDDILSGAASLEACLRAQYELTTLCMAGGFPLKKWACSHPELLNAIPVADRQNPSDDTELPMVEHSVLGLRWHSADDSLSVAVTAPPPSPPTKRFILSQISRLFDPLGWLAPLTLQAKLLLQTTWVQRLGWNESLADDEARLWLRLREELPLLETVRLPRWLAGADSGAPLEVHGFADASERAYAAVIYLRTVVSEETRVSLIMAKTKVAPLRRISLPRLDLCAAALLAKLSAHVSTVLRVEQAATFLWSDSTVTLAWIRSHPAKWSTFVANRVAEIQRLCPTATWRHLPGKVNPADCASRGILPGDLKDHPLWWHGPPFLTEDASHWPSDPGPLQTLEVPERRATTCLTAALGASPQDPEVVLRFSSLHRLLRVTAWMRRWRTRAGPSGDRPADGLPALDVAEISGALMHWVRVVQGVFFAVELEDVRSGRAVSARAGLQRLTPFLDDEGVLRVGGRLRHSLLTADRKHPIILPPASRLTQLIIEASHRRTLHGGNQATLAALRQQYWVPRGRQLVRRAILHCPTCVLWRAASPQPLMGDLPAARVTPSRPFLHTGIDHAGPVQLRTSKGRGQKSYKGFLAIFVCCSSRAVHLEVVSDYTSAAFLAAFRRFTSRRGLCEALYSDCGTNFVGAASELRALFGASTREGRQIGDQLATKGVRWRSNPPAAPHFGGLWEAAVKGVKHHLRRVIGEATLTYEELSTLLAEIEACLNSRPLQALTDDPEDVSALTPGHFLIGAPLNAIPEPSLLDIPTSRLSRWRLLQNMRDYLWQRWSQEYLQSLTPRPKWWSSKGNLQEGDLCLVKSGNFPPTRWPLARIQRLLPGKDGEIRVADLRTATGLLTRPVVKLVPLPLAFTGG